MCSVVRGGPFNRGSVFGEYILRHVVGAGRRGCSASRNFRAGPQAERKRGSVTGMPLEKSGQPYQASYRITHTLSSALAMGRLPRAS